MVTHYCPDHSDSTGTDLLPCSCTYPAALKPSVHVSVSPGSLYVPQGQETFYFSLYLVQSVLGLGCCIYIQ